MSRSIRARALVNRGTQWHQKSRTRRRKENRGRPNRRARMEAMLWSLQCSRRLHRDINWHYYSCCWQDGCGHQAYHWRGIDPWVPSDPRLWANIKGFYKGWLGLEVPERNNG